MSDITIEQFIELSNKVINLETKLSFYCVCIVIAIIFSVIQFIISIIDYNRNKVKK